MRKVTGYIGALIIVMALMGSILAGYALNVNGDTAIINEYETVTDVSGLYSHTDQKTYIDYNPASNYIGYELEQSDTFTINNPNSMGGGLKYKLYTTSHSGYWTDTQYSSGAFYNDGNVVNFSTTANQIGITIYRIAFGENFTAYSYAPDGTNPGIEIRTYSNGTLLNRYWPTQATFNFNGSNVAITFNGNTINSPSSWIIMPANNGDYVAINNNGVGYYQSGQMYTQPEVTPVETPIYEWNGEPTYNFYSVTSSSSPSNYFVPAVFTYQPVNVGKGINYTESNRVNNYPIEYEYRENTETQILPQIDLKSLSSTNYWPSGTRWTIGSITNYENYTYNGTNYTGFIVNDLFATDDRPNYPYCKYSLYDIVSVMDIPVGTTQIIFDTGTGNSEIEINAAGRNFYGHTVPSNFVTFTTSTSNTIVPMIDLNYGWVAYYTINTGLVDIYTSNGIKLYTASLNDTYVEFIKTFYIKGNSSGHNYGIDGNNQTVDFGVGTPWQEVNHSTPNNNPYLNVTAISHGVLENTKYLDPTKGVSIKSSNVSNVVWNNNYENGDIKLLFRAATSDGTYHNDISIPNNTISIDYYNSHFYISLDGDAAIDIGTWRNIILDIDLKNGILYAVPVRTFNSYTNVQMDNTQILIGDLTDPTPTNKIYWLPTNNSLTFNVYSTDVFMNTYGVVMADPTLTITDYFTNLDNFYRLELSDFSIYGDSITINNQTGNVTGNRVSFGDESVIIKKMFIVYENGHVYLSDSNMNIDLGEIVSNNISFSGAWYFKTFLQKGYTVEKQIYTWDWQDFILDNTEFCIIYIGLAFIGLIVARKFCVMSMIDYAVFIASIIIALGVQVIA